MRLAGAGGNLICMTATGKVLDARRNPVQGLAAWNALSKQERKPGAVKVEDLNVPPASGSMPAAPEGGLILKQYYRNLTWTLEGTLRLVELEDFDHKDKLARYSGPNFREAAPDFMWLTKEEWQSLVPKSPQVGQTRAVSKAIAQRIFRFQLVPDILYGESNGWKADAVREGALSLTVHDLSDQQIVMRLEGFAKVGLSSEAVERLNREHSSHGYEPKLLGELVYDRTRKAFARWDMVAVGDFYGTLYGNNRTYFRSGRAPLGVAFHLVDENSPLADREVCPRGLKNRQWMQRYFATGG